MTEKLTIEELYDLHDLADAAADGYDNTEYDEDLFEKYTALAKKLRRMVQEEMEGSK